MTDQNPIELRIDPSTLSSEDQALLRAFLNLLSSGALRRVVQQLYLLHTFEQAPVHRQAIALKLLNDRMKTTQVAEICGVSDRQLRRYSQYKNFVELLNQRQRELPRGRMDENGDVEE
jgi:hypothetical protein